MSIPNITPTPTQLINKISGIIITDTTITTSTPMPTDLNPTPTSTPNDPLPTPTPTDPHLRPTPTATEPPMPTATEPPMPTASETPMPTDLNPTPTSTPNDLLPTPTPTNQPPRPTPTPTDPNTRPMPTDTETPMPTPTPTYPRPTPTPNPISLLPSFTFTSNNTILSTTTSSTWNTQQLQDFENYLLTSNYNTIVPITLPSIINTGNSFDPSYTVYGVFANNFLVDIDLLYNSAKNAVFLLPTTSLRITMNVGSNTLYIKKNNIATTISTDGITYTELLVDGIVTLGKYNIQLVFNASSGILITENNAVSNICFLKDTPVETDQGIILIQHINSSHTIHSQRILAVTKTVTPESHLVQVNKHAFGDYPTQTTIMSMNHKVLFHNVLVNIKKLVNHETIRYIPYKGELLYNVLCLRKNTMVVNGMVVETLDPNTEIAKMYHSGKLLF